MTNITMHGDEATISSTVLDYSEFNNTLNNVKKFIDGLPMNDTSDLLLNPRSYNKVPENRTILNILNGADFSELGLSQLSDLAQLIKVIGLDNYDNYTVVEYAYIYTSLVEYFNEY